MAFSAEPAKLCATQDSLGSSIWSAGQFGPFGAFNHRLKSEQFSPTLRSNVQAETGVRPPCTTYSKFRKFEKYKQKSAYSIVKDLARDWIFFFTQKKYLQTFKWMFQSLCKIIFDKMNSLIKPGDWVPHGGLPTCLTCLIIPKRDHDRSFASSSRSLDNTPSSLRSPCKSVQLSLINKS